MTVLGKLPEAALTANRQNASKILALDPAKRCGFALSTGPFGVWQLDEPAHPHHGTVALRLFKNIVTVHKRLGLEEIACEDAAIGSPYPAVKQFHNELRGAIFMAAAMCNLPITFYRPKDIKLFATDSGAASKQQMIRALATHFKLVVSDDNAADAIWILKMRMSGYTPPPTKKQQARAATKRAKRNPKNWGSLPGF